MTDDRMISESLPPLEREVFDAVRQLGLASVADVAELITREQRALAYTTVMTMLSRLFRKGYLLRRREGKAYIYEARGAGEIVGDLTSKVARDAITRFGDLALTGFVQPLSREQRQVLAQLLADHDGVRGAPEEDDGA